MAPPTTTRSRPAATTARVDPRVQARRNRVARRQDLRRMVTVGGMAAAGSLAVGAIALANSSWLDVEAVEVVGAVEADPGQIVTASGVVRGEPLVDLDLGAVASAVEDGVPWVGAAAVERHWQGTVTIEVSERTAVAALPAGSRFALVDRSGQQLEVVPRRPPELLPVQGIDVSGVPGEPVSEQGRMVVDVAAALPPGLSDDVVGVGVSDGSLTLELAGGGVAVLGDGRSLGAKLGALETVLARVVLTCLARVDVTVPSNPAVSRAEPLTTELPAGEEPKGEGGGC